MYSFENPTSAFVNLLEDVCSFGNTVTVRDQETRELLNVCIDIKDARQRCLILPHRNDNIFAKIAETLWVLAGRSDIQWLSYYLPRAGEWSDDGICWRAGYGPRLRKWMGAFDLTDQVGECYELLRSDPTTRRAVMSLWNPALDYDDSLDVPCNNWLHWLIRDNKLLLNIAQRSSDILWGFSGINLFEWSVLQEFMAKWIGVEVGPITYFISSLHLYKKHYKRAALIFPGWIGKTIYAQEGIKRLSPSTPFELLDNTLLEIFIHEKDWREGAAFSYTSADEFIEACAKMLYLYISDKLVCDSQSINDRVHWLNVGLSILPHDTDFRLAAIEYYGRGLPEFWAEVSLTDIERMALSSIRVMPNM